MAEEQGLFEGLGSCIDLLRNQYQSDGDEDEDGYYDEYGNWIDYDDDEEGYDDEDGHWEDGNNWGYRDGCGNTYNFYNYS